MPSHSAVGRSRHIANTSWVSERSFRLWRFTLFCLCNRELQRVAVCSVLQCAVCCSLLKCAALCCSVMQCAAVCCSVLQCAAVCCSVQCAALCCSLLQCAALCCSVMQFASVCHSMLQCDAVCCRVLPCTAVCCRVRGSPKSPKHLYLTVDVFAGLLLQSCGYVRATFGSALAEGLYPGLRCCGHTRMRLRFIELGRFTCGCKMCANKDSTNINCGANNRSSTKAKMQRPATRKLKQIESIRDNIKNSRQDPSKPQSFLLRFIQASLSQDYESVQSILNSFGIVAALLLSILLSLMMTVPVEESVRGDIFSLSLSSPHFRCHFVGDANTIEICSESLTIALFGTTNATLICNDVGASMTRTNNGYHPFYCATDIPRAIRGGGSSWARPSTTSSSSKNTTKDGCASRSFKEAYQVAANISDGSYLEYLMQEIPASKVGSQSWFGWPGKFSNCQPSARLNSLGLKALLFLMLSLFWDLYVLVSLTFSSASVSSAQMNLWWSSFGCVCALLVFAMLLVGTIHFLYSLEYLIMIRKPSPYDQLIYKADFMDTFVIFGIWVSLILVIMHYVGMQLFSRWSSVIQLCTRLFQPQNDLDETGLGNDNPQCDEIKEIPNVAHK